VQPAYLGDRLPGNGVVGYPVMAYCRGPLPAELDSLAASLWVIMSMKTVKDYIDYLVVSGVLDMGKKVKG